MEIFRRENIGLYICNKEGLQGLNGVFKDGSLHRMLEAADIKKPDMILAFIGAMLDLVCA